MLPWIKIGRRYVNLSTVSSICISERFGEDQPHLITLEFLASSDDSEALQMAFVGPEAQRLIVFFDSIAIDLSSKP